jgi:integrase
MSHALPFSIFKRKNRKFLYVQFKKTGGGYLPAISTKQTTESSAIETAFNWLRDGIPKKNQVLKVNDLSLKDAVRKIKTETEAETLLSELRLLGWVKSYVLNDTTKAEDFISFLKTFWDWEKSPYIKEKLRKNHGIHRRHCLIQGKAITLYWEKFFKGRYLGDIIAADIDAFINYMGDMDLSASRKNVVIKAGTKPLRWAFAKGKIDKDPTRGHIMFSGEERKRDILSPTVAAAVFRAVWKDEMAKLANMLAAVTGMRRGEIIALRFQDIGPDCLYVRGSWNSLDKIKLPKNNKTRTVQIPFPDLINGLMEQVKQNPWGVSPDSFVFWSDIKQDVPMWGASFVEGLREVLIQIGFTESEAKKYMFHSWRHFFTTYLIGKLDKKLLKSQTGHLTDEMLAHYGDHETARDREIIQATEREVFAGLLPEHICTKTIFIPELDS